LLFATVATLVFVPALYPLLRRHPATRPTMDRGDLLAVS
jgi:hypothetical protein